MHHIETVPALTFVLELRVQVAAPIELGETPTGKRRVVGITGGSFEGPGIRGTIAPGGADWQYVRSDGVLVVEARYTLQTEDGIVISVVNTGLRHGEPEVIRRLTAGEDVDPSSYYFKTTPRFEVGSSRYDWLNRHVFIAEAERLPDSVVVRVFRIT